LGSSLSEVFNGITAPESLSLFLGFVLLEGSRFRNVGRSGSSAPVDGVVVEGVEVLPVELPVEDPVELDELSCRLVSTGRSGSAGGAELFVLLALGVVEVPAVPVVVLPASLPALRVICGRPSSSATAVSCPPVITARFLEACSCGFGVAEGSTNVP
jgi:hypothetical protein